MIEFDPNKQHGPEAPKYATYIPSRHPNFKVHKRRSDALGAIGYRAGAWGGVGFSGVAYEWIDGEWKEIDRYEPPVDCAHCGRNLKEVLEELKDASNADGKKYAFWTYAYEVRDPDITPKYKQKRVCIECYQEHFTYDAPNKLDPSMVGKRRR